MKADPNVMEAMFKKMLHDAAAQTFDDAMNGKHSAGFGEEILKKYIGYYKCGLNGDVPEDWISDYMEHLQ
jgi:hypothetical protein